MSSAADTWRVRFVKLDEFEQFDFERHDDILYRQPDTEQIEILVNWRVDIVGLRDGQVRRSYEFGEELDAAREMAQELRAALKALTSVEFGDRYMVTA